MMNVPYGRGQLIRIWVVSWIIYILALFIIEYESTKYNF